MITKRTIKSIVKRLAEFQEDSEAKAQKGGHNADMHKGKALAYAVARAIVKNRTRDL